MDRSSAFEHYRGFINAQLQPASERTPPQIDRRRPVITISRQAGSGAWVVANELVAILRSRTPDSPPWTIFDRNLVERVLSDHDLPTKLAAYMPEDRVSEISDTMDGLFGLRPSSWTLVRKTADTILRMAELGNVVVIGRGASVITGHLNHAFHVRLTASLQRRIDHVKTQLRMDLEEAATYVRNEDLARSRYLKKYYDKDIDDPLLYHMVINMDRLPYREAARLIAEAASPSPTSGRVLIPQKGEPAAVPTPR